MLQAIVARPETNQRNDLHSCTISLAGGVDGDHWAKGCWKSTEDGKPHPDVQICIMNSRCTTLVAQQRDRWPLAGDNLFIDMDIRPENLPIGQKLSIGSAIIEISQIPHNGCEKFVDRFGRAAVVFVNAPRGKALRLRGVYARVVVDGRVTVGDRVTKID
jgi:MOSC domain-containing protein YiiM